MAERVVSGAAEQRVRRPGASSAADVGVVARPAESPEILDGAVAREAELARTVPDLFDGEVADVAAGVLRRRQRRAAFDRAVRFDAEADVAGGASLEIAEFDVLGAPAMLVRPEIAEGVGGDHQHAEGFGFVDQLGQVRHQVEDLIRLHQHLVVVDGVAHGHGQIERPVAHAGAGDLVEQPAQMRQRRRADLGVHAADDLVLLQQAEGAHGVLVGALHAAQLVVQLGGAVEGDAAGAQPRLLGAADALFVEGEAAALQAGMDAMAAEGADDVEPVAAEEGLAADDGHFAHAKPGELPHDVQALLGRQLRRPRFARPRPAVHALQIAGERDLPDCVDGMAARVVLFVRVAMRQLSRVQEINLSS